MTLNKIFVLGLINDNTKIVVRDSEFQVLSCGNWYQNNILDFLNRDLESFTWDDDNSLYVDVKS